MKRVLAAALALILAACAGLPPEPPPTAPSVPVAADPGREVVMFALGLIDTGYRYGGKNPQAGLDCSGMVSHVFAEAAGLRLTGSAAEIARAGRPVERPGLRGGDLVFFDTLGRPYSHVGIYIGDNRFVHAPSTAGRVRIDRLDAPYYAQRYDGARTYFD